jgi:putative transposase
MAVSGEEFLRRFLLHVLPRGFVRIRFFGFLANRRRAKLLPLCQQLLEVSPCQSSPTPAAGEAKLPASWLCPRCGSEMVPVERLSAQEIPWIFAKESHFVDFIIHIPVRIPCMLRHAHRRCVPSPQNGEKPRPCTRHRTLAPHFRRFLCPDREDSTRSRPTITPYSESKSRFKTHDGPRPPQTPPAPNVYRY